MILLCVAKELLAKQGSAPQLYDYRRVIGCRTMIVMEHVKWMQWNKLERESINKFFPKSHEEHRATSRSRTSPWRASEMQGHGGCKRNGEGGRLRLCIKEDVALRISFQRSRLRTSSRTVVSTQNIAFLHSKI